MGNSVSAHPADAVLDVALDRLSVYEELISSVESALRTKSRSLVEEALDQLIVELSNDLCVVQYEGNLRLAPSDRQHTLFRRQLAVRALILNSPEARELRSSTRVAHGHAATSATTQASTVRVVTSRAPSASIITSQAPPPPPPLEMSGSRSLPSSEMSSVSEGGASLADFDFATFLFSARDAIVVLAPAPLH